MNINRLYHFWWIHDAQWYQKVVENVGYDMANKINKEILQHMAMRIAKTRVLTEKKDIPNMSFEDIVEFFCLNTSEMWPEDLLEFKYSITDDDSFEVNISKNFSHTMLKKANSIENYSCPCLEIRAGWFDGMGITPKEDHVKQCMLNGAECCTIQARL